MDSKIIKLLILLLFIFSNHNLLAVEFIGKFNQGSFILGKTNPEAKVKIDNKDVLVTKDGYFAFGIGRDRKNDIIIRIVKNKKLELITKKVFKRFSKQRAKEGEAEREREKHKLTQRRTE